MNKSDSVGSHSIEGGENIFFLNKSHFRITDFFCRADDLLNAVRIHGRWCLETSRLRSETRGFDEFANNVLIPLETLLLTELSARLFTIESVHILVLYSIHKHPQLLLGILVRYYFTIFNHM